MIPNSGKGAKAIAVIGMATSWLIEIAVVFAFFVSVSREWVMWIAGPMFTFFGVWNFVMIWNGSKNKFIKFLHGLAWITTIVVVLQSAVSYGLAQGQVTSGGSYMDVKSYVTGLTEDRKKASAYLEELQKKNAARSSDELRNRAQDEKDIAAATLSLKEIDDKLAPYVNKSEEGSATVAMNAQMVFEQLYGTDWRLALGIFFLIFGLLMETTLSLSAYYSFKNKEDEVVPEVKKDENSPAEKEVTIEKPILVGFNPPTKLEPLEDATTPPPPKPKRTYNRKPKEAKPEPPKEEVAVVPVEPEPESIEPSMTPAQEIKKALDLEPEEEIFHEVKKTNHPDVYIRTLFDNGTKTYLRDKDEAAKASNVPMIEALKIFEFLTHTKHEGVLLVEFRKETGKYHPNVTSEWILNYIQNNNIAF